MPPLKKDIASACEQVRNKATYIRLLRKNVHIDQKWADAIALWTSFSPPTSYFTLTLLHQSHYYYLSSSGTCGGSWADTRDDTGITLVLHQKFTECLPYTRCATYWMLRINWWVRHFSCLQEVSVLSLMGLGFNILTTSSELAWIYRLLPEPLVLLESSQLSPSLPRFSPLPNVLFNKSSAFCNKYCFNPLSMFTFTLFFLLSHLSTCYIHGALRLHPRRHCVYVCVPASSPYPELPNSLKAGTLPFSLDMLTMSCSDSFA